MASPTRSTRHSFLKGTTQENISTSILIYTRVNVLRVLLKRVIFLFVTLSNILYICNMNKELLIYQINQGYSTWKIAELNNTTQPNIRYWLKKYELKTQRTINQINNNRKCLTCNLIKTENDFYKRGKKYISHCKTCYQKTYTKKSKDNKQKCVDFLGGKCSKCGYNKCNAALDFHHIDSTIKKYNLGTLMKSISFDKIKSELDKCVLLCANCHREHHSLTYNI